MPETQLPVQSVFESLWSKIRYDKIRYDTGVFNVQTVRAKADDQPA